MFVIKDVGKDLKMSFKEGNNTMVIGAKVSFPLLLKVACHTEAFHN